MSLLLVLIGAAVPSQAQEVPQSQLSVAKEADRPTVSPGNPLVYTITLSCSAIQTSCINPVLTDELPKEFIVTTNSLPTDIPDVVRYTFTPPNPGPGGGTLTAEYLVPLPSPPNPSGSKGLIGGTTQQIRIPVQLASDSAVPDKSVVTNTAIFTAENAPEVRDSVDVTVDNPSVQVPVGDKTWTDGSAIAGTQEQSNIRLGVRNNSRLADVRSLSISDLDADTFEHFNLRQLGPVATWPAGADRIKIEYCTQPIPADRTTPTCTDAQLQDGGTYLKSAGNGPFVPAGLDLATVTGVKYTFLSPAGATLTNEQTTLSYIDLGLVLRDTFRSSGALINAAGTRIDVVNTATPTLVADQGNSSGTPVSAPYSINPPTLKSVTAKQYCSTTGWGCAQAQNAFAGQGSPVLIDVTARDDSGFNVAGMSITDPTPNDTNAKATFDTIDVTSVRVDLPQGAAKAVVTATCRDNSTRSVDWAGTDIPAATLCPGSLPASVKVEFTGTGGGSTIVNGSTGRLRIQGTLNAGATAKVWQNCAASGLSNPINGVGAGASTACGSLDVKASTLRPTTAKTFFSDTDGNFAPDGQALAGQNSGVGMKIDGKNTNEFAVDSMTITEPNPANSQSVTNFAKVDVTKVRVTPPAGTTSAKLVVTCRGSATPVEVALNASGQQTVTLSACPGGFPSSVQAVFAGAIAAQATGTLELVGTLNNGATAGTLRNCAATTLTDAGSPGPVTVEGCGTLSVQSSTAQSTTTKAFCGGTNPACPSDPGIVVGQNSPLAMTVTGTNTSGFDVETLTIFEPQPGNAGAATAFGAVDAKDIKVRIPAGATSTTVTATCRTGTPTPQTLAGQAGQTVTVGALCSGGGLPATLTVAFTGTLANNASGALLITGNANGTATAGTLTNCAQTTAARPGFTAGVSQGCNPLTARPNVTSSSGVKTFVPDNNLDYNQDGFAIEGLGSGVSMTITGRNTTGFSATSLTITEPDPGTPAAVANFAKVDITKIRIEPPSGGGTSVTKQTVTVTCRDGATPTPTVFNNGSAHNLTNPCGASFPATVSVAFEGTITANRDGRLKLAGTLNSGATAGTLTNCAVVQASAPGSTGGTSKPCGSLTVLPNTITVAGSKTFASDTNLDFTPDGDAIEGQNSGVVISVTGRNTSAFPVSGLTIADPDAGDTAAVEAFAKVDVTKVRLTKPTGATGGTLTATCRDGSTKTVTLPNQATQDVDAATLCGTSVPSSVRVTFTGTIAKDQTGTLAMVGRLNDKALAGQLPDCATATVSSTGATDVSKPVCSDQPLTIKPPSITFTGQKTSNAPVIVPGQPLDFNLSVTSTSNVPARPVVIADPPDPTAASNPFRYIRLLSVTTPASPASVVSVYDPDAGAYVDYNPGNAALLARATGIKVTITDGLAPGAKYDFGYQVQLRDEWTPDPENPNRLSFINCAQVGSPAPGAPDFCTGEISIQPGTFAASVNKTFNPPTLKRPFPGDTTSETTDLQAVVKNTGDLNLSTIVLTDVDPDFWAGYVLNDASAIRVNLPKGADRVRLDVCTSAADCAAGTFIDGVLTASTNPVALPAGVTPDQVWGIRVTFTRADGKYLIVPDNSTPNSDYCKSNSLCVRVKPLPVLRTTGAITPEITENTLTAGIRSIRQDQANPDDLFPLAPVAADVKLVEQQASMDIDKDPNTSLSPGSVAPFTLVIENTGRAIIPDLLVRDPIPANLEFNPTPGVAPFTVQYELPTGTPEPTGLPTFTTKEETVTGVTRTSEVQWTWPGWAFVPGARVKITFQVRLAPGVPADTVVRNTAEVTSRPGFPFTCTPDNSDDGEKTVDGQKYCTSWAEITSLSGNQFRQDKWVAGDDSLGFKNALTGVIEPTASTTCPRLVVDGRAYTHYPCVALNNPGQAFAFLLRMTNAGNTSNVFQINILDTLPVVGDKGILLNNQQRGTGWVPRPVLLGPPATTNGDLATQYTTFDTVGQDICFDDQRTGSPNLPAGCDDATWSPTFTGAASAFSGVLTFPADNPLSPGETAYVRFDVDSPLDLTNRGSFAWNTFALQVGSKLLSAPASAPMSYLPPAEPIQAGIGILFGALKVTKTVVNPPAGVDLGTFPVEYRCTTTKAPSTDPVSVASGTLQIAAGQSADVPGPLPAGSTCRIWETDSKGADSPNLGEANALTVVITSSTAPEGVELPPQQAEIVNTFPQGSLTISKVIDGPGAALLPDTSTFTVEVKCTFRGSPVTGFNPWRVTLSKAAGLTQTSGPLPRGAICTTTETVTQGAVVTITPTDPVEITSSATPIAVEVKNTYPAGSARFTKTVDGPLAGLAPEGTEFTLKVACEAPTGFPGAPNLPGYPASVVVRAGPSGQAGPPVTLGPIPLNTQCTVTEIDTNGADPATVNPSTFKIEQADQVVDVAAVNTYRPAALRILKKIDGAGASLIPPGTVFTADVVCTPQQGSNAAGFNGTVAFGVNDPGIVSNQPVGSQCTVTEKDSQGAAVVTPQSQSVTLQGPDPVSVDVTITNTFNTGQLRVTKVLDGPGAGTVPAGTEFMLEVSCTFGGRPVEGFNPKPVALTAPNGLTQVLGPLPVGALCTTVETQSQGAAKVTIMPEQPVKVTDAQTPVEVTVTNTFEAGTITVKKVLSGPGSDVVLPGTAFTVLLDCKFAGKPVDQYKPATVVLTAPDGLTQSVGPLAIGTSCTVTESGIPAGWELVSVTPDVVQVGATPVDVEVTNTRKLGELVVSKKLVGDVAGAATAFTVDVDCEPGTVYDRSGVVLNEANGWTASFGGIPTGVSCTVTESGIPDGWELTSILPSPAVVADAPVTVEVTNTRKLGELVVAKKLVGDVAGAATAFTVDVDCEPGTVYDRSGVVLNEANGWTASFGGIPTGVSCTVTESGIPDGWELTSILPSPAVVGDAPVTVAVTNTRKLGELVVAKKLVGNVAGAATAFTVDVDCEPGTAYDRSGVVLNEANGWTARFGGIPTGVSCTVTESGIPDGWELTSILPSPAVVGDAPVTVAVTNTRKLGDLVVAKKLVGDVAGAATAFTVDVDCEPGTAYDRSGVVLNEANGWTASFGGIPTGVSCTVTESGIPDGWELTSILPSPAAVGDAPVTVEVTNTRKLGELVVSKKWPDDSDVAGASTDFTAKVDCSVDTYDATVQLNKGNKWTETLSGIPTGVTCSVTEVDVPEGWQLLSVKPEKPVTIGDAPVQIEMTNKRKVGDLVIVKRWPDDSDVAGASTKFTAKVDCSVDTYDATVQLNKGNKWTETLSGIPTGVTCSVTEVDVPEGWQLLSVKPEKPVTIGDAPVEIRITNKRQVGDLIVKKVVTGPVPSVAPEFTAQVDCTVDTYDATVPLNQANNWTETLSGIPTGVSCTVTEPVVPQGWELTSIEPGTVTVGDEAVQVTVTNNYLPVAPPRQPNTGAGNARTYGTLGLLAMLMGGLMIVFDRRRVRRGRRAG